MKTFDTPFYADIVVEELRNDVEIANAYIGKDLHSENRPVDLLYTKWLYSGKAKSDIRTIEEDERDFSQNFSEQIALIAVGIVGLIRCIHVDLNEKFKVTDPENHGPLWDQYAILQASLHTQILVDIQKLKPISIQGDPTFWKGEFLQDRANTFAITSNIDKAKEELSSAISAAKSESNSLGIPSEKQLPYLAAINSSQAVAEIRLGRLDHNPQLLLRGLRRQQKSMKHRPDKARMKTLSEMTLKHLSEHRSQLLNPEGTLSAVYASILRICYSL